MLLFSNGGAKKKKAKTRKSTAGRVSPVIDVRSRSTIAEFEKLLEKGPITIVLIYADWCGACHRFREETWDKLKSMENRTLNIGAVREDMLANTSLNSAKISHYPSLLLVGQDKKPAEFKTASGETTNALPNNDEKNLEALLKTPVDEVLNSNNKSSEPIPPSPTMNSLVVNKTNKNSNSILTNSGLNDTSFDEPIDESESSDYSLEKTIKNASLAASTPTAKAPVGGGLYKALQKVIRLATTGKKSRRRRNKRKATTRKSKRT